MSVEKGKTEATESTTDAEDIVAREELTDAEVDKAHGGAMRLRTPGSEFDTLFAGASNFDTLFAGAADLSPNLIKPTLPMPGDPRISKLKR